MYIAITPGLRRLLHAHEAKNRCLAEKLGISPTANI